MIKIKNYTTNNDIITNELLVTYINNFWIEIFKEIKDTNHLLILCKAQFTQEEMGYRTLGHLRKVNFSDRKLFIEYLTERLSILNDSYVALPISNIIFTYIIKEGQCSDSNRALLQDLTSNLTFTHNYNNMKLPISMNPSDYGEIIVDNYVQVDGVNYHRFIVNGGTRTYQIDISSDSLINKVRILGKIDLSWIDTKINGIDSDLFTREINKSTVYFMDGQVILRKQVLPAKPFKKTSVDNKLVKYFYTLDIETFKENGKLNPYLICAYNGIDYITSYNKNNKALFTSFLDQLLSKIQIRTTTYIYAHNLSGFDGIFLMRHLLEYGKLEPLLHNGKLISIKLQIKDDNKTIIFKDSFLMLPLSLRKLCKAFNIENFKGYFPFLLKDLTYKGEFPKFEFFTSLPLTEYINLKNQYSNKIWSFKEEAIKYCELDCVSLHQIISKFSILIFKEFKIDPIKVLTLPALAMKIWKTFYMPKDTVFQLNGQPQELIRKSYTGGAVDVYIPHNHDNEILFDYDVNALYPSVMKNNLMPVGKPVPFLGNIRNIDPAAFGFFYCKITSPDFLDHPILQRSIKISKSRRTIAGLGTWLGWIFSEEMDNAVKFGYTFEILKGYEFKKADIFSKYIDKMYNLRLQYPKGDAFNLIAKLLMNSLYGKFGMKSEMTKVEILDNNSNKLNKYLEKLNTNISEIINLEDKVILIFYINKFIPSDINDVFHDDVFHALDVNIAIASAITAYARIRMSYFKNNPAFKLYNSDTDNIVINKPLPKELVGNKLGQLKLEHTIKKAVFLAPKVYGLVDFDGNEIIKVKGITHDKISELNFENLEQLLVKNSQREFTQEKFFKKIIDGEISVSDVAYTLKVTSNKRFPIYKNIKGINIYDSTRPYNYDEINS